MSLFANGFGQGYVARQKYHASLYTSIVSYDTSHPLLNKGERDNYFNKKILTAANAERASDFKCAYIKEFGDLQGTAADLKAAEHSFKEGFSDGEQYVDSTSTFFYDKLPSLNTQNSSPELLLTRKQGLSLRTKTDSQVGSAKICSSLSLLRFPWLSHNRHRTEGDNGMYSHFCLLH